MPTYEYRCGKCDDTFEVFQSFSARPLKKHDVCGGNLSKVFHSRGIIFKGSGYYTTDSRSGSSSDSPKSESSSSDRPSSSSGSSGSDSSSS